MCLIIFLIIFLILGDSGGKVPILGEDIIGHFTKKNVRMNLCLILNGYRDRASGSCDRASLT